ncbi:MAG TPA: hypothetical protein PLJ60_00045 [Chryseolinea sp.]|nr:hypothetical protein [Chryseolinea sp.]HPH45403.1 hypothetical protein [Chryseolinea sp.]HPM28695.1 hypothetical protein [Chryseolinea sp.]
MIPIRIGTSHKLFGNYHGFSFFIFIFYWKSVKDKQTILNHELIHFWQQVELLFVLHWLLYITFYLIGRLNGKTHDGAYMNIPFEKEAYAFEKNYQYASQRKPFAWLQFLH